MRYAKFAVAVAVAALTALQAAMSDGTITAAEWVTIGVVAAGALGVYLVPNRSESPQGTNR